MTRRRKANESETQLKFSEHTKAIFRAIHGRLPSRFLDRCALRDYIVEGKKNLGDGWGPTNAASRFFRVKVKLP